MSPAIGSSLGIVIYMALFAATGIAFLFVNLLVGMLLRPHDPQGLPSGAIALACTACARAGAPARPRTTGLGPWISG